MKSRPAKGLALMRIWMGDGHVVVEGANIGLNIGFHGVSIHLMSVVLHLVGIRPRTAFRPITMILRRMSHAIVRHNMVGRTLVGTQLESDPIVTMLKLQNTLTILVGTQPRSVPRLPRDTTKMGITIQMPELHQDRHVDISPKNVHPLDATRPMDSVHAASRSHTAPGDQTMAIRAAVDTTRQKNDSHPQATPTRVHLVLVPVVLCAALHLRKVSNRLQPCTRC
jgi:hypothetical protein